MQVSDVLESCGNDRPDCMEIPADEELGIEVGYTEGGKQGFCQHSGVCHLLRRALFSSVYCLMFEIQK